MSIRVGFASGDGRRIDQDLLCAKDWWIYDIGDTIRYVERRELGCACDEKYTQNEARRAGALRDCSLLFVREGDEGVENRLPGGTQVIRTHARVKDLAREIQSKNRQKISLDYYRKVQELWRSYRTKAGT